VPAAWPYVDLENSTGTIFTDGMSSCSVHLVPMSEYLLAGWNANITLYTKLI
jgi:hypothetical protein